MIAETKFYGATGGRKFVLALRERKRESHNTPDHPGGSDSFGGSATASYFT